LLKIEHINRADLIPYARNARTHSEEQVNQIAASITEFGFTTPILVDENNGIIAGHGRLQAAIKLNMATVPAIRLSGLSEAKKRALVIADNKLAMNAGWDLDLLKVELSDLGAAGFDLSLTGFSDLELGALMADKTAGLTDPDDVPALADPVSVLGDAWVLGRHRLVCGDCTEAGAVDKALNGVEPHLMVTDPPYGVGYDASWRADAGINARHGPAHGKVLNDDRADWSEAWALFPGEVCYVWHAGLAAGTVADSLIKAGLIPRSQIIWNKGSMVMGRGDYHWKHEPCWYAVKKGSKGYYGGDRKQTTVWDIAKPSKSETGHSTQKPVECMKRPIENNSSAGQAVYEPFSGSGTTIIAAEMTGRACHAIELSPQYVDMAVRRWEAFTGKDATLDGDGRTFKDVESCRKNSPSPGQKTSAVAHPGGQPQSS
jgi:DNA modification methylase